MSTVDALSTAVGLLIALALWGWWYYVDAKREARRLTWGEAPLDPASVRQVWILNLPWDLASKQTCQCSPRVCDRCGRAA